MSDTDTDHDQEMRDMETQELLSEYERLTKRLHACVAEIDFRFAVGGNKSNKMPIHKDDLPGGINHVDRIHVAVRNVNDIVESDD